MNKKILSLLICIVMAVAVFAGCASGGPQESPVESPAATQEESAVPSGPAEQASEPASSAGGVFTDLSGNEVSIEKADKIVSLTPAGTEIVCAVGAADRLVGIDASSNYPEITKSIEVVGDFNGPDVEKVAALEPDVVLAGTGLQQDAVDKLKSLGIPVAVVEATTFDEIPQSIKLVGAIVGMEDVAQQVVDEIDAAVKDVQENKPKEEKTVYYAMSYGDMGNWTSGPGSFINTIIELAGGKCVTDGQAAPWIEYPVEDLVAANPDIILMDSSMGSTGDIARSQGYEDLDAVNEGRVYGVDADIFTRPGPRIADALKAVSEILND
ncbi:ABC transporter substrate-binding protein [Christensenellaceae bacterium]|nr:ABC transporter substrate-binding protein [Christensenellaceae bacterium]BDF60549.1 ABC transporter substrate-binding protein [Christensenellaceae bacterium]